MSFRERQSDLSYKIRVPDLRYPYADSTYHRIYQLLLTSAIFEGTNPEFSSDLIFRAELIISSSPIVCAQFAEDELNKAREDSDVEQVEQWHDYQSRSEQGQLGRVLLGRWRAQKQFKSQEGFILRPDGVYIDKQKQSDSVSIDDYLHREYLFEKLDSLIRILRSKPRSKKEIVSSLFPRSQQREITDEDFRKVLEILKDLGLNIGEVDISIEIPNRRPRTEVGYKILSSTEAEELPIAV